jgi:hypothetical protein
MVIERESWKKIVAVCAIYLVLDILFLKIPLCRVKRRIQVPSSCDKRTSDFLFLSGSADGRINTWIRHAISIQEYIGRNIHVFILPSADTDTDEIAKYSDKVGGGQ